MDNEKRDQEGGEGGAGRSKRRGGDQKKTQNHYLTAKEQASPADGEKSKFHAAVSFPTLPPELTSICLIARCLAWVAHALFWVCRQLFCGITRSFIDSVWRV